MLESAHVRLADLFQDVQGGRLVGSPETRVTSLAYRSDQVSLGSLFFCVPGFLHDGHDYAPEAVERGAVALCVERLLDLPVAQVVLPSVRRTTGPVAAAFYRHPSARLLTVGITGTNGKTTSAYLVAHLLDAAGLRAGLLGTIERRVGGVSTPAGRTTPEAVDVQRDLAAMLEAGDKAAVMEVSSHALDLGRVLGIDFRVVAFTNLTQDHLDYHDTLEAYFEAKRRLFVEPVFTRAQSVAVINVDDEYGRLLAEEYPAASLLTFSTSSLEPRDADLVMRDYVIGPRGTRGTLEVRANALRLLGGREGTEPDPGAGRSRTGAALFEVQSGLVGAFNVANVLTALGIGIGLGLDMEDMLAALREFPGVPGRMERVEAGQPYTVLVDYAHTPDSVRNVLETARAITKGRLIAVLGCGGDRDRGKRPQMGREAGTLADRLVITSDNPRSEDPGAIIAEILGGVISRDGIIVEADRREAIRLALAGAHPDDVVLILGQGTRVRPRVRRSQGTLRRPCRDPGVDRGVAEGRAMIPLSAAEVAEALGLDAFPGAVHAVSTDTRTMRPGDLFVALQGENFDGHAFVAQALCGGASAALVCASRLGEAESVSVRPALAGDPRVVPVQDTIEALGLLARAVRRKSEAKVIAVTGSVGKTSTKDLIAAMAGRTGKVVATAANQNNEIGVPLTLLSLEVDTELAVVEMGMRGKGQIAALARIAEADVGVITNIYPVHLELLGSLESIAEAKAELILDMDRSRTAVIPAACAALAPYLQQVRCRTLRFALGPGEGEAEVWGQVSGRSPSGGAVLGVRWPGAQAEVETPFLSRHRLENTVAAVAACYGAGLDPGECIGGVRDVVFSPARGDVVQAGAWLFINDTYNANPAAVRAAIDDLVDLAVERGRRPMAVLGDMLELGQDAARFHEECGRYAAQAGVQTLWGVGLLSHATAEGFTRAAQAGQRAVHVETVDDVAEVRAGLRPDDVVLFKASRSVRLETMVSALLKTAEAGVDDPSHAGEADRS